MGGEGGTGGSDGGGSGGCDGGGATWQGQKRLWAGEDAEHEKAALSLRKKQDVPTIPGAHAAFSALCDDVAVHVSLARKVASASVHVGVDASLGSGVTQII